MFDEGKTIEEVYMYNNCKYSDISTQLWKIIEELNEVKQDIVKYKYDENRENLDSLISELYDLMQSCHTLIINLKSREDRQKANHNHIQKLLDRYNEVK